MNKILNFSIRLKCDTHHAFEMFTTNKLLESWLTELADVEPKKGGNYELFWEPSDKENNSTIGCKVTAVEADKFISFEWKGPKQFKHFMNNTDPLTHVVVVFIPCVCDSNLYTDVLLIHSGWKNSPEWDEARLFFENAWTRALSKLIKLVNNS
jgi:uncharacterized protein YndB with AHSA1/START domain